MENIRIEHLTFSYPGGSSEVLKAIDLQIHKGEFITLCGPSGCGKSTLLRHFKTSLQPHGSREGTVYFDGQPIDEMDQMTEASAIGFVMQSPDNQIVTDKVWHELAFGLESLGMDNQTIRLRVAEMSSFLGIQNWFHKNVTELSGGQKQLLNLGAVLTMHPSVLILDEPTSQLDPIAAVEFLTNIRRVNRELGITIIITEHRLDEVLPYSDRVIVMDQGEIICADTPSQAGAYLKEGEHAFFESMPVPMRIYAAVEKGPDYPITVREGRQWLDRHLIDGHKWEGAVGKASEEAKRPVMTLDDLWFRYEKRLPDVVKGLSMEVGEGEVYALLGGNGTGKTTTLSLIAGLNEAYRGQVIIDGINIKELSDGQLYDGLLGVLPQAPESLFTGKTVEEDLMTALSRQKISQSAKVRKIDLIAGLCRIDRLLDRHPFDLSGGEQQRAALAKVLLLSPKILLMDEPTKGLDGDFKNIFAAVLKQLKLAGVTVLMVSHDIEFCAAHADRCALFFDGGIVSTGRPQVFFSQNSFYTTSANRMARHVMAEAVSDKDVIEGCGVQLPDKGMEEAESLLKGNLYEALKACEDESGAGGDPPVGKSKVKEMNPDRKRQLAPRERKLTGRTMAAVIVALLLIPMTIFIGSYYLGDRKYYFISLLIIIETMVPFIMIFEHRKPQARELIIIAVLCAIGVAGRSAFFMLPQFKPVVAIVIIAGVAFGGETGFLVGTVTAFVSNMFFGQGPWTPWQMFAFGMIGLLAGILFRKGLLRRSKTAMALFGGMATLIIYGGIMNPASVIMFQSQPTMEMFLLAYLRGIPFDMVHAGATVFFLWLLAEPVLEKLDRVKEKYGLI